MEVTELGIETEDSDVAPLNAFDAIVVRESGSVIDLIPVRPQKAFGPIDVTLLSRTTSPAHLMGGAGNGRYATPSETK